VYLWLKLRKKVAPSLPHVTQGNKAEKCLPYPDRFILRYHKGCHSLIRQGAKLVEKAEHILEELAPFLPVQQVIPSEESSVFEDPSLDQESLAILNHLGFEPTPIDTVVERSGLTPEAVSSMLLVLELQDYIQSLPGGTYTRIK